MVLSRTRILTSLFICMDTVEGIVEITLPINLFYRLILSFKVKVIRIRITSFSPLFNHTHGCWIRVFAFNCPLQTCFTKRCEFPTVVSEPLVFWLNWKRSCLIYMWCDDIILSIYVFIWIEFVFDFYMWCHEIQIFEARFMCFNFENEFEYVKTKTT